MPIVAALLLIVQISFAYHAIKNGKEYFWIYIIIFVPLLGCILYFLTQVLPEAGQSSAARKAKRGLVKAIDPKRELRKRKELLELSNSLANRLQLADECMEVGFYDDAISLYQDCLKGIEEHNPHTMLKLAQANFALNNYQHAKEILEDLMRFNPDFRSTTGHLLYARTLENLNLDEQALHEYEILSTSYPGEEARTRYALLLKKGGKTEEAIQLFRETLTRAKHAPRYYRKREKEWIAIAQSNV